MAKASEVYRMAPTVRAKRRRRFVWTLALILLGSVVLPLGGYVYVAVDNAFAQTEPPASEQQTNPRANYWRAVREGVSGYTAASGPYTTNVLIQNGGQNWREFRNGPVSTFAPWFLAVAIVAIGAFYFIRGTVRLEERPAGAVVERWTLQDRILHWYTATLFILLAISGLSLLFGRAALIPLLGLEGFAAYAAVAIALHNYIGPFFLAGVLLELIAWFRFNIPTRADWEWFRQGGGIVGRGHPAAGRMNGGEKAWYWVIATVGMAVCITGLILDFPLFGQTRAAMQTSNVIHDLSAVIWIAVALGHMYIGSIGTEGALEAMTRGTVSAEWAKQHHSLWYEKAAHEPTPPAAPEGESPRAT